MPVSATDLRQLMALGLTDEQILGVIEILSEPRLLQREAGRRRTAKYRALRKMRESDWEVLRQEVIARDGAICTYCGGDANPPFVDHMLPVSRGGENVASNLTVACGRCNSSKRDQTLEEWAWFPE